MSENLFFKSLYITEKLPRWNWGWHIWTFRSSELFCLADW